MMGKSEDDDEPSQSQKKLEEKDLEIVDEDFLDKAKQTFRNSPRKSKKQSVFSFSGSPRKIKKKDLQVFDFNSDNEHEDDPPKKRKRRSSKSPRRNSKKKKGDSDSDSGDSEDEALKKRRKSRTKKKLQLTDDQKSDLLDKITEYKAPDSLKGVSFFISGKYSVTKDEVKGMIEALEGTVSSSVSGKVTYMLVHPDQPLPTTCGAAEEEGSGDDRWQRLCQGSHQEEQRFGQGKD